MIYLDHNATSPMLPEVRHALAEVAAEPRGNPSSLHELGRRARARIDTARQHVADLMGCRPEQICFTAGGTEANVLALRGVFETTRARTGLCVAATEHPAVTATALRLAELGLARLHTLPVDDQGRLLPLTWAGEVGLVCAMAANNETGVLHDVENLARQAHSRGALFHCDAVQALGKLPVNVTKWAVDSCAVSAHKLGGPQGVGALYVADGHTLSATMTGGGQERGLRSGTENVAGIVGFGVAAEVARANLAESTARILGLRDQLEQRLRSEIADTYVFGRAAPRLPNTSAIAFAGVKGEALVVHLDALGLCASTGSACSSASGKASPVLVAMHSEPEWIRGALRLSLGPTTTRADIDQAATLIAMAVARLRALAA